MEREQNRSGVLGLREWTPRSIVSECRGSYRVTSYRITRCPRGRTLYQWECCWRGGKHSEPQLRDTQYDARGTLHHRAVDLAMIKALAERHGWPPQRTARLLRHATARGIR